jgi:signal transduction histidine kinase/HD-like signal output (HDOD) protein
LVGNQYTLQDLPATSQVLFQVLELCQYPNTTDRQLASSIMLDPVLCATVLSMTADQLDVHSIEPALMELAVSRLGRTALQSITLDIARRLCQQPQATSQQAFNARLWQRMILAAKLARAFAILTQYSNPDEAYLAGLLQGIGHLRVIAAAADPGLLRVDSDELAILHAEGDLFDDDPGLWAAQLVQSWPMPGYLADALRYQAYTSEQVADAHPLVRLSSLAAQLASHDYTQVNQGLDMARQFYAIHPSLGEEILSQARGETQRAAAELSIQAQSDFSPQPLLALGRLVDDLLQVQTLFSALNADESAGLAPRKVFARVLGQALGCKQFRCLIHDAQHHRLLGFSDGDDVLLTADSTADWQISLRPARSAMAMAFDQGKCRLIVAGASVQTVADEQVLDLLIQPAALCLPVIADADCGLLVVAGGSKEAMTALAGRERYLQMLCAILARRLRTLRSASPVIETRASTADNSLHLRKMAHEVSNPLNIAGNYLSILKHKLTQAGGQYAEIDIISEELQRAIGLMRNMGQPDLEQPDTDGVDVNACISRLLRVYRATMLEPRDIVLTLQLDPECARVNAEEATVEQIVRNLLINAVEAVDAGGHICIATNAEVYTDSGNYVALRIADDGPGIAMHIRQKLFQPVQTTKGDGHSGLGLSIVKSLVDQAQGNITFRSSALGTEFQVYLPPVVGCR